MTEPPLPILIVEDEGLLLSFLETALTRGGIRVMGAASAAEALELLKREEFAGVVSDLRMPGEVSGVKLFEWVRENRPQLSSRFIFMTGNAGDSYAVKVREATGAMFIEKPFGIASLIALIKKITASDEHANV